MANPYRIGRIAEKKIVNTLKAKRFRNIRRSKGSRGPADIYAKKKGKKYYIQVKSKSASITKKGIQRLRKLAKKRCGVAVVIHRKKGKNKWRFFGNWR